MSQSGVAVNPDCITAFNELKLGKNIHYIIYKLSDDFKEIVVEHKSTEDDWEGFVSKLLEAKSAVKGVEGNGPRFAIYDIKYKLKSGEGERNKITFISWSPDEGAPIKAKMTYASSKEGFKHSLSGIAAEVQANREDELEFDDILSTVSKGTGQKA